MSFWDFFAGSEGYGGADEAKVGSYIGGVRNYANKMGAKADAYQQWFGQEYDWFKDIAQNVIDKTDGAMDDLMEWGASDRQRYEDVAIPLQDAFIKSADYYSSKEGQDAESARAGADVDASMAAQRESTQRQLESYGIDPGRLTQGLAKNYDTQNAIAKAMAMNNARARTRLTGEAMTKEAANMLNPLAAQAVNTTGAGVSAGTTGAGVAQGTVGTGISGATSGAVYDNLMGQGMGMEGDIYRSQYGATGAGATQGNAGGLGELIGGAVGALPIIGDVTGWWNDGGVVEDPRMNPYFKAGFEQAMRMAQEAQYRQEKDVDRMQGIPARMPQPTYLNDGGIPMQPGMAPPPDPNRMEGAQHGAFTGDVDGSEVADRIPAMLSENEYVIPADVVKRLGTQHFDKLIEKTRGVGGNGPAKERKGQQANGAPRGGPMLAEGGVPTPTLMGVPYVGQDIYGGSGVNAASGAGAAIAGGMGGGAIPMGRPAGEGRGNDGTGTPDTGNVSGLDLGGYHGSTAQRAIGLVGGMTPLGPLAGPLGAAVGVGMDADYGRAVMDDIGMPGFEPDLAEAFANAVAPFGLGDLIGMRDVETQADDHAIGYGKAEIEKGKKENPSGYASVEDADSAAGGISSMGSSSTGRTSREAAMGSSGGRERSRDSGGGSSGGSSGDGRSGTMGRDGPGGSAGSGGRGDAEAAGANDGPDTGGSF